MIGRVRPFSVSAGPIRNSGHPAGGFSVAVGFGEFAIACADHAFALLDRAVAQHQVREVQVEFVRRHIGTLRHEAHIAQRAGIDDGLEILAIDRVQFAGLRFVDQVE